MRGREQREGEIVSYVGGSKTVLGKGLYGKSSPPPYPCWEFFCLFDCYATLALSGPVRDTPPYRAIPFRDSIAEGGIAPICLVFIGYRASIAEIPLGGGVSHLHFACSPRGRCSEKGRGYRTELAMLRHENPIARNRGVSLR